MEASLRAEQEEFATFRLNIDESTERSTRRATNDSLGACEDASRQTRRAAERHNQTAQDLDALAFLFLLSVHVLWVQS